MKTTTALMVCLSLMVTACSERALAPEDGHRPDSDLNGAAATQLQKQIEPWGNFAGGEYPITVRVSSDTGQPVQGATINWAVLLGGGSVLPAASVTDSTGVALTNWTFGGTVGEQAVVATLVGVGDVTFSVIAQAGRALTFVVSVTLALVRPVAPGALTAQAFDKFGNQIANSSLEWFIGESRRTTSGTYALNHNNFDRRSYTARVYDVRFERAGAPYGEARVARAVFAAAAAGANHSCTFPYAGTTPTELQLSCGGLNVDGQVGGGGPPDATYVERAAGIVGSMVTAGAAHTCAIKSLDAYCWGSNAAGQLGIGSSTSVNVPTLVPGINFYVVSAGADHTCGIEWESRRAMCWGANTDGQLGTGDHTPSQSPVYVNTLLRFYTITTGEGFTCALTFDAEAYCWGRNNVGQLGDNSSSEKLTPVPVEGDGLRFEQIDAGDMHTCALSLSNRQAYCWGSDHYGQLGDGTDGVGVTRRPARVQLPPGARQITAGGRHTCAASAPGPNFNRFGYCWGANEYGQLGIGTMGPIVTSPAQLPDYTSYDFLSAGGDHSCGTGGTSAVTCWGLGVYNQLLREAAPYVACGVGEGGRCVLAPIRFGNSGRTWF